ncbi:integrase [Pseudomonas monteilii]|uniref:integrase n=1 Tax=Pseudomonas monteilii TaxID=76759 RepID=UPI00380AC597
MHLPPELEFLNPFFVDPSVALRRVDWLISDFDENHWEYSFGFKTPKVIDWDVQLDDGSRLIDSKNRELLDGLKYFLTSSTNPLNQSVTSSSGMRANELGRALHIVDFLLLNAKSFGLAKYGLAGLGRDALKLILAEIGSSNDSAESVYGWSKRLSLYCLNLALETNPVEIELAFKKWPSLKNITAEQIENNTLDIPLEMIPRIRASLYINGIYRSSKNKGYVPNSATISKSIYRDTLKGRFEDKPVAEILSIKDDGSFFRELLPIAVTTAKREKMGEANFREYRRTLYRLGNLHEVGLPAPTPFDLNSAREFILPTDKAGRFRTLPSRIVFGAVRNAIEFHIKHGRAIIDGLCKIALHCKLKGIPSSELSDSAVRYIIGDDLRQLGVEGFGLSRRAAGTDYSERTKGANREYYSDFRANKGLLELVKVYIGSAQVVIGALMGRRIGELKDLHASNCLDISEQWLVFENRKSTQNLFGLRQIEVRPIEPIAVQMIKNLVRMQKIFKRLGYINELKEIFCSPSIQGALSITNMTSHSYNQNLDFFCDYFETETNDEGKRYYIRQHQLRRFFAMLFFYSSSFGGLETLQWMLGHTDVKHVWHYITEAMDGATLKGAKAQYVAEAMHNGEIESYENLAALITARYGTEDFTLVDTDELEDYLSDLMDEGAITIEPEFFEDDDGQRFKVIAQVTGVAA